MTPLAEIIATRIPPATLERVAHDQNVVAENKRAEIFKATGLSRRDIADRIVPAYGEQTATLAFGLYEQIADSDWQTASLLTEHFDSRGYFNLQASLTGRVPTLPLEALSAFFSGVRRHICLIVARKGQNAAVARGTGFLIGPDLVLTCRHVLAPFAPDDTIDQQENRIDIYFDFLHGDPVQNIGATLPRARHVGLAEGWHIVNSPSAIPDGVEDGSLTDALRQRLAHAFDFVLLRLKEPIGRQPVERGGGLRRGWISLPDVTVPQSLQPNDWILIPQHPQGFPLRIGMGQFQAADPTGTRIRYSTGASPGSSGAPCFNQGFKLVGIHNAYVGPEQHPLANQAIRFDHILPAVVDPVTNAVNGAKAGAEHVMRWSIARPGEDPQVILGRDVLLKWLAASASPSPVALRDRVYVAYATLPGAGCSFSSDVLHAEIRDSKIPRAVYGRRGQQIPATVDDFLDSLLRELGIDAASIEAMPARPGPRPGESTLPALEGEVDKIERWLSDELPGWLGRVIESHVSRTVDMCELARATLKLYQQRGVAPPDEIAQQAASQQPVLVRQNPWDYAYVVIDDLRAPEYQGTGPRVELKGEVRSLVAALIQGKPENAMPSGLRRLRWLLLGDLPDFLKETDSAGNGAVVERLNPSQVGSQDVLRIWERMAEAYMPIAREDAMFPRVWSRAVVKATDQENPPVEKRLQEMQEQANFVPAELLKEVGQ